MGWGLMKNTVTASENKTTAVCFTCIEHNITITLTYNTAVAHRKAMEQIGPHFTLNLEL